MTATAAIRALPEQRPVVAMGWMVAAQAGFALMNVGARAGGQSLPWQEVVAFRFGVGVLVTWLVAMLRHAPLRITDRKNAWARSCFGTLSALCGFYALTSPRIHLGDAATLSATAPIIVAILAPFALGERAGRLVPLAGLVAFAGVALVLQPSFNSAADVAAIAALGAFFYALATLSLRRLGPGESSEAVVLHFSLVASVVTGLLAFSVWQTPTLRELLLLVGTGAAASLAQLAMTRAYGLDRAVRVAILIYLGVVFTHILAIPLFDEKPSLAQVLGALLVIGAGGLLARSGQDESEALERAG